MEITLNFTVVAIVKVNDDILCEIAESLGLEEGEYPDKDQVSHYLCGEDDLIYVGCGNGSETGLICGGENLDGAIVEFTEHWVQENKDAKS